MDYMVPPIMLCVNGHNVCDICRSEITLCPICRKQFLSTRNVALEKLARDVKYPCPYRKYGCEEFLVHDKFREHQNKCHYLPQTCPASKLSNEQCSWTGIFNDIKKHLMEQHRGCCYEYIEGKFRVLRNFAACMSVSKFVFAFNEIFFLRFHANNDNLYAVLKYIGPAENAAKYKYKIEFVNADNTEGVTVMHLTRSFDENLDDIFKAGNCGKVHYDVVSRLVTKDGGLKFKTRIFRVGE